MLLKLRSLAYYYYMSSELSKETVYERGVELRKRVVARLGGITNVAMELGANSEMMFYLGRGEFDDGLGSRTFSLEVLNREFSLKRTAFREIVKRKRTFDILSLKNTVPRTFSADGLPKLSHQINDANSAVPRGVAVDFDEEAKFLQLFDADIALAERVVASSRFATLQRDEVA